MRNNERTSSQVYLSILKHNRMNEWEEVNSAHSEYKRGTLLCFPTIRCYLLIWRQS